jgi:hypothetical protein
MNKIGTCSLGLFLVKIIFIFSSSVSDEGFLVSVDDSNDDDGSFSRAGFFGGTARGFGNSGGGEEPPDEDEVVGGDGVKDRGSSLLTARLSPSGELLGPIL